MPGDQDPLGWEEEGEEEEDLLPWEVASLKGEMVKLTSGY